MPIRGRDRQAAGDEDGREYSGGKVSDTHCRLPSP
jgi:hypothetical protein